MRQEELHSSLPEVCGFVKIGQDEDVQGLLHTQTLHQASFRQAFQVLEENRSSIAAWQSLTF